MAPTAIARPAPSEMNILVADDQPEIRRFVRATLGPLGHNLVEAADGASAVRSLLERQFAVILLDVRMPDMSGFAAARLIRSGESSSRTPIIFLTGLAMGREEVLEGYDVGAADYLIKPFQPEILRAKVAFFVEMHRMQEALARSEAELRQVNEGLDQRVQQRTRELADTNQALQQEMSERAQAQQALRGRDRMVATLLSNLPGYAYRCRADAELTLEFISDGVDEITGHPAREYLDGPRFTRYHNMSPAERSRVMTHLRWALADGLPFEMEYRIRSRSGEERWVWERARGDYSEAGELLRIDGFVTDITARKRAERQLEHTIYHDPLTNLANRQLLRDRLEHCLELQKRGPRKPFAVLLADLDRFKLVNDSLGHTAGDLVLIEVAQRIGKSLRAGDTLARLGGDEFALLLENLEDAEEASAAARRIREAVRPPVLVGGQEVYLPTASVGIALSSAGPPGGGRGEAGYSEADQMLRDADTAMYRAKEAGRDRHVVFDITMRESAMATHRLDTDLRHAVSGNELRIRYQPIVELLSGEIAGFEALVRWQHPERGLLAPGDFMPLAEETGLVTSIDQQVLRAAGRQCSQWSRRFHRPITMSVNVSTVAFGWRGLAGQVMEALREAELPPGQLKLEVTESALVKDPALAATVLQELHEVGVQICVDDFGTGFSNLSSLSRYPISCLKIDRVFVVRLVESAKDRNIVECIVLMAHKLGMVVVAEGVETAGQAEVLRAMGCDFAQGYYYSKPVDLEGAESLLAVVGRASAGG